jgi:hypothetical protein
MTSRLLDAVAIVAVAALAGQRSFLTSLQLQLKSDKPPAWLWVERAWDGTPMTLRPPPCEILTSTSVIVMRRLVSSTVNQHRDLAIVKCPTIRH